MSEKLVLMINKPESCEKCMYWDEKKTACGNPAPVVEGSCPFRPMPRKKRPYGSDFSNDYVRGYNECIDDIEGNNQKK